jgi:hypothetical protein
MTSFETYARLGGDDRFRWIAERNLDRFFELDPEIFRLREQLSRILSSEEDPNFPPSEYYDALTELNPIEEERDQSCVVGCVFTALYFEAFIYDYAATCIGDRYVLDHIDKLDFISKWVVVPRLTVGKEIDKSAIAYASLKRLHRDRNSLVHLKSRPLNLEPNELISYLGKRETDLHDTAKNCRAALTFVIAELAELDPEHPKLRLLTQ